MNSDLFILSLTIWCRTNKKVEKLQRLMNKLCKLSKKVNSYKDKLGTNLKVKRML